MENNRRKFIKQGGSLAAALSIGGIGSAIAKSRDLKFGLRNQDVAPMAKDAGMQLSEAYFGGLNEKKIALAKQMDVLGAVGGVSAEMVKMGNANPWDYKTIVAVKEAWTNVGLNFNVVEGPPTLGNKIKLGLEGRDEEIANFITFMKNLSRAGVDVICYNWMPVIGWYRTKKDKIGRGGALVTEFDYNEMEDAPLTEFGIVSKEAMWKNLEYFLKAVVPEAEKVGMKLAMHPDDPQVDSIKGISRIMTTVDNFKRMVDIYPSPSNGITMCQGNFSLMGAEIPEVVKYFGKRNLIHFVHFRNVRGGKFKFVETFHDEGQIDMYAAMKAYYDIGFKGPIRPDHVPTMYGDSNEHPGYSTIGSLYAFGYIRGLMEAVSKEKRW